MPAVPTWLVITLVTAKVLASVIIAEAARLFSVVEVLPIVGTWDEFVRVTAETP